MSATRIDKSDLSLVMLLGTFHFANPKLDAVSFLTKDVTSEDCQSYLAELAQRVSEYRPTAVLLEYPEAENETVNERYVNYLNKDSPLALSEIEQLGFRFAKLAGLDQVHGFDERSVRWLSDELYSGLENNQPLKERFDHWVESFTTEELKAHSSLSLRELLRRYNDPSMDQLNKSVYLITNSVGAGEDFIGADAAASWWRRNFRMFARIQKLAVPGERLVVIAGQGHTAILRDMLKLDPQLISVDALDYL